MQIYACIFVGRIEAIVLAHGKSQAKAILADKLDDHGLLSKRNATKRHLIEIPIDSPGVVLTRQPSV